MNNLYHIPAWLKAVIVCASSTFSMGVLATPVDYVDLAPGDGININDGKIIVTPVNGEYAKVSSGNTVTFHQRMKAGCQGINNVLKSTTAHFGAVTVSGGIYESDNYYSTGVAHQHAKAIAFTDLVMDVPLNKLEFNPVQVCKDMLQSKMNQGSTKLQVMSVDQIINKPATFSGVAACGKISGDSYYDKDYLNGAIEITCKAGAAGPANQIQAKNMVIPAVPMGGNGNVQVGVNPLEITEASILANELDYTGQCPKQLNFTARFKGGGKGSVRYSIVDKGKSVYKSAISEYDSANGWMQNNFNFVIPVDSQIANKKYEHIFKIYIEVKDEKANKFDWSKNNNHPALNWSHTCLPSVAVPMGQQGGIKSNNQGGAELKIKVQPEKPGPANPDLHIQAQPAKPVPHLNIQAKPTKPGPVHPNLKINTVPADPDSVEKPKRAQ